jgi:hypothetical protein
MRCLVLAAMLVLLPGCGRQSGDRRGRSGESVVQSAVERIGTPEVASLEILCFPRYIEVYVALTPEQLEKASLYRIVVKDFASSPMRRQMISALEGSTIRSAPSGLADYRWACIFRDEEGTRVFTMHFDGLGQRGLIGETPVELSRRFGKLRIVQFLEGECASLWE